MENYHSPGKVLPLTAPSGGVVSGSAYLIGGLVVLATFTAAEDAKFSAKITGVEEVAKVSAQAWTEGVKIYFDAGASLFTTTAGGNTLVGVATKAAANPSATGFVRFDGVTR